MSNKPQRFIDDDGTIQYVLNGKRHREDGPALISPSSGVAAWYIHGKLHRIDGPAMTKPELEAWFVDGRLHREDGPALIMGKHYQWWLDGQEYSQEEFWQKQKNTEHAGKIFAYVFGDPTIS